MPSLIGFVGKTLFFVASLLFVIMPRSRPRVRVMIINDGNILLIKNLVGTQQWELPGGGVHKDETEQQAAYREVKEEVSIIISKKSLMHITTKRSHQRLAPALFSFYRASPRSTTISRQRLEILAADWFPLDALPSNIDQTTHETLQLVISHHR